ncbi:hypothetical protein NP493_560g00012 [Ridgeia piscesae]|uniref:Uncharacterized protein n=1 Tax=Ridgeia piscesae TaxID=27915 RepID=A0AAD9NRK3_RIDPI|nr:hypothetical protein NP493_560g00012 [Ridgeia piscesae]
MGLAEYNIDITALCETRFSESGSLNELEYSFFLSGKPEGERREAGVGFAIKKDITKLTEMPRPVSDRVMTMRLPLSKDNFATIISVYAPTITNPDENKEASTPSCSTPDQEWAALQQVVYNTTKTYLGKPNRKHQDWFDPNDQELQTLMSRRDQSHQRMFQPGAQEPPLQHTKMMHADCYKNAPVH